VFIALQQLPRSSRRATQWQRAKHHDRIKFNSTLYFLMRETNLQNTLSATGNYIKCQSVSDTMKNIYREKLSKTKQKQNKTQNFRNFTALFGI
jgi:hypothetical protein